MEKVCEICGAKFETVNPNKKRCSLECAKKAKVVRNRKYKQAKRQEQKKICPICGKEFKPSGNGQKYCSAECSYEMRKKQNKLGQMVTKVCVICGKEFMAQSRVTKACSPECSLILRQQQGKGIIKNIGKDKVIEVPEEELKVRMMSFTEDYHFKTLRQAVNFLSLYTEYNTAECIELLRERKDKIGEYKIIYD